MFYLFDLCSAIKLRPKEGETYFDVVAVIDPVTREAQRLATLLLVGTAAGSRRPCDSECRCSLRHLQRALEMLQGTLGRAKAFLKMGGGSENNFRTFGWLFHVIKKNSYRPYQSKMSLN